MPTQPVLDERRYGLLPVIGRACGMSEVRVHAPHATKYKWGYVHGTMQVDGAHATELLLTPLIDRDIHAIFLKQIANSDPSAWHVVLADQDGFHLPENDPRIPPNLHLLPLPPYCSELNPVERLGGLIKAQLRSRLYCDLRKLEDHIMAAAKA